MKKIILFLCIVATVRMQAQNVGIGTTTPSNKLSVNGNADFTGNVGIGTNSPGFPLNFSNSTGDKISLYGNTGAHYGLGIQSALLQIHSDGPVSDIAFGQGSSATFTERARIINSGMDGMRLKGRLHILNGSSPLDAAQSGGVWLYKADNSDLLSFVGTQNNQNVGFFGGPVNGGWGFVYDAVNSRVGIGTNDPGFPLNFPNSTGDKISLFGNSGAHYGFGVQNALLQIHTSAIGEDIAFGYGSSISFSERMRIKGNGNVGIGTTTPSNKLSVNGNADFSGNVGIGMDNPGFLLNFPALPGDKLSLYGNTGVHYGFGIQSGLLQIHTDLSASDIAFGYGSSASFTERMRIKGNGNVGIGTNAPNAALQLGNFPNNRRIVLWETNNNDNEYYGFGINSGTLRYQVNSTFSDHVFYAGTSATASSELLRIKGNGALALNGNAGQAGQVLMSNGITTAAAWVNPGTIIKTGYSGVTSDIQLPANAGVDLTASQYTITLPRAARVILYYKTTTFKPCSVGSCNTKWVFYVSLNGNYIGSQYYVDGTSYHTLTGGGSVISSGTFGPDYLDLGPGTHTISVNAWNSFNQPEINSFQIISTIIEQ